MLLELGAAAQSSWMIAESAMRLRRHGRSVISSCVSLLLAGLTSVRRVVKRGDKPEKSNPIFPEKIRALSGGSSRELPREISPELPACPGSCLGARDLTG